MFLKKTLVLALGAAALGLSSVSIADPDYSSDDNIVSFPVVTIDETTTLHDVQLTLKPIEDGKPILFELTRVSPEQDNVFKFGTIINGGSEATPVASMGSGFGNFSVKMNGDGTATMNGFARLSNLKGVTGGHIHQMGAEGQNDTKILDLRGGDNFMIVPKDAQLDADQTAAFKAGKLYINIHTAANPSGEIRGNLASGIVRTVVGLLNGGEEVPAITTDAMGDSMMRVNLRTGGLKGYVNVKGAADATAAHIHAGKAGEKGAPFVTLEAFGNAMTMMDATGSVITMNSFRVPAGIELTVPQRKNVLRGNTYVNVHTTANPTGEVRGQLRRGPAD
jgi:predicted nuclease of predicted toxin-antitoxin system